MSEATINPTWGYRPDGSAQIFDLGPGQALPDGWHPSPTVITDPARATAEALSATVARTAETPRRPAVHIPPSAASDAITVLEAENDRLAAEVAELRKALDASQAAHAEALAHIETLATQLAESLTSAAPAERAQAGGDAPDIEPSAASAPPPARTRDEARGAIRALLGEDLTDREIARRVGVSPSTVAAVRKAKTVKAST